MHRFYMNSTRIPARGDLVKLRNGLRGIVIHAHGRVVNVFGEDGSSHDEYAPNMKFLKAKCFERTTLSEKLTSPEAKKVYKVAAAAVAVTLYCAAWWKIGKTVQSSVNKFINR